MTVKPLGDRVLLKVKEAETKNGLPGSTSLKQLRKKHRLLL